MVESFRDLRNLIADKISSIFGLDPSYVKTLVSYPPRDELGDLTVIVARLGVEQEKVRQIVESIDVVEKTASVGPYLNIYLKRDLFAKSVLEAIDTKKDLYGIPRAEEIGLPRRIVIEYVSANPIHPLHIGTARNAALGQALMRMLKKAGCEVQTRFYINDVGKEVAILAYGAKLLGELEPPEGMKPDHWIGLLYAATHLAIEVKRLRRELEKAEGDDRSRILKELDRTLADLAKVKEIAPDIVERIVDAISREQDPEARVSEIMRRYEQRDPEVVELVRRVVTLCLEGVKQSLERFGAPIDVWDWESELVWSSEVSKIIEALRRTPYVTVYRGALAIDFTPLLKGSEGEEIRKKLRIPQNLEIPPLILVRSDGTTLYTTRDIAYSLKKFREFRADMVINVIASEQTLPQAQVRLALYILGYRREAENLIHYSYEIVQLPGTKMSSRRGRIVTLDEVLDEAKARALAELEKRGSRSEEIAEKIGVAAVKFALLSVTPTRPVKFVWENVLNFERNSAPYLLYTYARCCGIIRKAIELGIDIENWCTYADYTGLTDDDRRWRLIKTLAMFSEVVEQSLRDLDPSRIATYLLRLADEFNSWYDADPVVREPREGVRAAKIGLVKGVAQVMRLGLEMLGIEPLERM